MTEFRARIGRVRMKNGGADIHVLDRNDDNDGENWRGKIIEHARQIAEQGEPDSSLSGFLVIGFFSDGRTSTGFRYDKDRCPIPRALMPSWIAEIIRRDMITGAEAEYTFNQMYEWRE